MKPLQALDKLVPKVPVVEWLLRGRDGAVVAAFYRVRGPLSDPTVTPVPLKNVGRNVFGIFHRLLKLPEAITGPRHAPLRPAPSSGAPCGIGVPPGVLGATETVD